MDLTPDEKQIADLLSKLKKSSSAYPAEMLAVRRQRYIQQVANAGLGIGIGTGFGKLFKGGSGTTTVASKVVEVILITAIVIEAGTVAYLYRTKIAELMRSTATAELQQGIQQSNSNKAENSVNGNQASTLIPVETGTPSETPSGTPDTNVTGGNNSNNNSDNTNINATPQPGDNNGNQFGLTPKPERTKDPNNSDTNNNTGGGNNGGGGNNNKP